MVTLESLSRETRETFWRSLQTMNVTRVAIAVVLLLYLLVERHTATIIERGYGETCAIYLALGVTYLAITQRSRTHFLVQLSAHLATDIVVISLLYLAAGGLRSGLVILYLFPLAGAAILAPLGLALAWTAVVALFLLADAAYQFFLQDRDMPTLQAGLYGAAYFAAVLVISRLARRLIRQEELALRRGADLAVQSAINQLVMADMGDGILVCGPEGTIETANPAARRMLGLGGSVEGKRLSDSDSLAPLAAAFSLWASEPDGNQVAFVHIKPFSGGEAMTAAWHSRRDAISHLKLRFARPDGGGEALARVVVFLQDVTAIENRAQELKLASMGRLTASIAHEVRNPLSAIGHATALLAEDLTDKAHVRLLAIVSDNVTRVNRMVQDILQLSRKVQPNGEPLALGPFLEELRAEFQETHKLPEDLIALGAAGAEPVRFDPLHLREVVVNLLNNAVRYASGTPGCIRIEVLTDRAGRRELHVQDDGPGITPEVRAHLFEPFYTTSSKGTGLGLYLARELCLNNDASLDYEYRFEGAGGDARPTGRFVITFARPKTV
ncbi:MAG: sensor histidine kinase [Telluria sp.]